MDLFRTAAAVLLVTVMVATFCNGFSMTRMDPHSRFAVNSHIARLKMVTISRHPTAAEELIGIDSVIAAVDDLIFDIDDSADQEKVPPTAVNSFPLLLNAADVTEFSALLKQMAAKRRRLKESDRPALSSAVIERLDSLNDELFSDCIWSMGTLRCGLNDFAAISSTVKGKSTVQQFWDKVAQVSETADRLCITRLAIGLGKMGLRWDSLPSSTQASVIKLVTPSDSSIGLESRELATVLFTLGQLGVTTDLLPEGALPRVLDEMASIVHNFTPQGLSNALHGLARMGVLWTDLPVQAQSGLPMRGASIVKEMRPDELCSIMQSMAVMKVSRKPTIIYSFSRLLKAMVFIFLFFLNLWSTRFNGALSPCPIAMSYLQPSRQPFLT